MTYFVWDENRRLVCSVDSRGAFIISIKNQIGLETVNQVLRGIERASGRSLLIVIDSCGGYNVCAKTISDALQQYGGHVRILVAGRCYSAATHIICAVPKEQRFALPGSYFLVHGATLGKSFKLTEQVAAANEFFKDISGTSDNEIRLPKLNDWIAGLLAAGTRLDKETMLRVMECGGNLTFDASAACENGLVGEVVE